MPGYISEVSYTDTPADFVEIAVPKGSDVSGYTIAIYDASGVLKNTMTLGTSTQTVDQQDVYVINGATPGFQQWGGSEAIALIDDLGNVVQFISFDGKITTAINGPANGSTSTNLGFLNTGETFESTDGGGTYQTQNSPNMGTIPCYAPGTLIDTPDGPRAVESLQVGDLVDTLDHGVLPIRWVRQGEQVLDGVGDDGKPIMIREDAFGPGRPARDLVVSPQHRILVGAAGQLDGIFGAQYFAPAKALTGLPFIRAMMGAKSITWVQFALDSHEVVWANGCLSESLLLGPMVLNGLTALQRRALSDIFGAHAEGEALNGPVARDCLKVRDLQRTIDRLDRASKAAARAA